MPAYFTGQRSLSLFALALLGFLSATALPAFAQDSPLATIVPFSSDESDRVNASAKGLAGLRTGASWEQTSEWKSYEDWIDGRWSYISRVRLTAMRTWAGSELGSLPSGTVFYPFSGPDVLYVNTLFPNSKYLVMAGLEPVGTMPDLATLQENGRLGTYLQQVKTSLFTILAASFFKTKDMQSDFHNQLVDGLLPAIVVFLARENYSINSISYVTLGHDGSLNPHASAGANGIQITYDDGRTLLYLQTDLGNDGLKNNPGFVHLMSRLGPGVTYLKAASYLLYEDYFSTIRNAILDNSDAVVEDDSGIPFRDFKADEWTVYPYGNYTGPIGLFHEHYQPDLTKYYAANVHPPLSFGSGYKYIAASSSLLVAKKK